MNLFETIDVETRKLQLQFLIIGGLAINQYGYSRETADLDILASRDDREKWLGLFAKFGYGIFNDGGNFIQLSPPEQSAWPVDFMLVDIWIGMARPALELVAPHLRPGAIVVCNNTERHRREYADYFAFLGDPANGFRTMTLPFNGGLELSVRCQA